MDIQIGTGIKLGSGLVVGAETSIFGPEGLIVSAEYYTIQNLLWNAVICKDLYSDLSSFNQEYDFTKLSAYKIRVYRNDNYAKVWYRSDGFGGFNSGDFPASLVYTYTPQLYNGECHWLTDVTVNTYENNYILIIVDNTNTGRYYNPDSYYLQIILQTLNN